MLNPIQKGFFHAFAAVYAWRKAGTIADAFSQHLDAVEERKHDRIIATRMGFKLAAGDTFGTSDEPVEGDSVVSESIWDWHRALALRGWAYMAKGQAMQGGNGEGYATYLDSLSFMSSLSTFKEATVSNRVLSNVYAGLLPDTAKMHRRDTNIDLMTDYVAGLQVVWNAAAAHDGHQNNILTRLQMGLPDAGTGRPQAQEMRQVVRFIKEVSPQRT